MAVVPAKGPDLGGQLSQAGQTLVTQQQSAAAPVPAAAKPETKPEPTPPATQEPAR